MLQWLISILQNTKSRATLLEKLEHRAHYTKEQLNQALVLANESSNPVEKVINLELAKSNFKELQSIAAQHPKMRLKNEKEVDAAIKDMEHAFSLAGYYFIANSIEKQNASAHVKFSQAAQNLLKK